MIQQRTRLSVKKKNNFVLYSSVSVYILFSFPISVNCLIKNFSYDIASFIAKMFFS